MSIIITSTADSGNDPSGLRSILKYVNMPRTQFGGRAPRYYGAGWSEALDEVEYRIEMDLHMRRAAKVQR